MSMQESISLSEAIKIANQNNDDVSSIKKIEENLNCSWEELLQPKENTDKFICTRIIFKFRQIEPIVKLLQEKKMSPRTMDANKQTLLEYFEKKWKFEVSIKDRRYQYFFRSEHLRDGMLMYSVEDYIYISPSIKILLDQLGFVSCKKLNNFSSIKNKNNTHNENQSLFPKGFIFETAVLFSIAGLIWYIIINKKCS